MLSPETSAPPHNLIFETKAKPPLRCFFYCRKSTEDDGRQIASIESQRTELEQRFRGLPDLEIVGVYEEARTAKTPGRPIFAEMLARIEAGDANCIVAWAPDRLARNSVDGGHVIYLLDRGILLDLKFATYTFENNSQGKFMLSIMFGQSKYYSDALSDNVKRGNRAKAAKGWRPNAVPLGYRHDPSTRTIVIDPVYFPFIRRMFDLMLTGGYSARQIAILARDDWGLRTPTRWKRGGRPLAVCTVHRILTNRFYAGLFSTEGQERKGSHEPVLTEEQFQAVQTTLRRPGAARPKKLSFPFTGLIRCGACGRAVTAENKVNAYGRHYTYYHCARSGIGPKCKQASVRAEVLEEQIVSWLRTLTMHPDAAEKVRTLLQKEVAATLDVARASRQTVEQTLRDTQAQITELVGLRLRNLLTDDEFVERRQALQGEAAKLARRLDELAKPDETLIPRIEDCLSFSVYATDWFSKADDNLKRLIVKAACSHTVLTDKILSFEAAKWASEIAKIARYGLLRGGVEDVRTLLAGENDQVYAMRMLVRKMEPVDVPA